MGYKFKTQIYERKKFAKYLFNFVRYFDEIELKGVKL